MRKKNFLFQRVFNSNRSDYELLLDDDEMSLASFVYDVAFDEIHGEQENPDYESDDEFFDTDSVISFDEKIEAAMKNFEHVVEVFNKTNKAKDTFLKSFQHWEGLCKNNIQCLRAFAEEMQTDKFNSDIARIVGGVVGAIGGILVGLSFLTPLAAVTFPLAVGGGVASALGGGVVAGTTGTELVLVKTKLDKAKKLIIEEKERFSAMAHWFSHPEELEKAIDSLLDYNIFKEIAEQVQKFLDEVTDRANLTVGDFKNQFKQVLKLCIGKMSQDSKIMDEFGDELAPAVMTFIFVVCLMRDHNRIVLDCVMITQRLALGLMSVMDLGVQASQLIGGLVAKGAASAISRIAVMEIFIGLGVIIDVLNVILSSIDIHKRPETVHAKKIKEVAEKFETVFLFIENVYKETRKYESTAKTDSTLWTTIVVNHVPFEARQKDIKMSVESYILEESRSRIKLQRLPTNGNNWLVKVPASQSKLLLEQAHITIKGENCTVTQ